MSCPRCAGPPGLGAAYRARADRPTGASCSNASRASVGSPRASRLPASASTTAATGCTLRRLRRSWRRCAPCSVTTCNAAHGTAASAWRAASLRSHRRLPTSCVTSRRRSRRVSRSTWPRARSADRRADTFAEVVRASLGPTMTDRFYAPYVEKLFGVPATGLAGELARRRVGARSAAALVRRVVRPDPNRGIFFYPRRGYGQISEALAEAATSAGCRDPHRHRGRGDRRRPA